MEGFEVLRGEVRFFLVWVGAERFDTVSSETATETETFYGAFRCDFEAKTEMKPNCLVRLSAVSNSFGLVFEKKKMYN